MAGPNLLLSSRFGRPFPDLRESARLNTRK
jgi:hypothetical protein